MKNIIYILLALLIFSSCEKEDNGENSNNNENNSSDYIKVNAEIKSNNFTIGGTGKNRIVSPEIIINDQEEYIRSNNGFKYLYINELFVFNSKDVRNIFGVSNIMNGYFVYNSSSNNVKVVIDYEFDAVVDIIGDNVYDADIYFRFAIISDLVETNEILSQHISKIKKTYSDNIEINLPSYNFISFFLDISVNTINGEQYTIEVKEPIRNCVKFDIKIY